MILGTVCGIAHGVCLPLLLLVFGEMTDIFINADATYLNETYLLEKNCSWEQFGLEWEDIEPPDGDWDDLE